MVSDTKTKKGLVSRAYKGLLEMMADGRLRQADIISHRELASRMGVSTFPVSKALKLLEQEGLVELIDRVGTKVCRVDAEAMWGMLQWRVALECQVARLASEFIEPVDKQRLLDMAKKLEESFTTPSESTSSMDGEFHLFLGDLSRCKKLRMELERLNIFRIKQKLCETVSAATRKPPVTPPNHVKLAEGIIQGDPEKAEQLMRLHLEGSFSMYGFTQWYRETYLKKANQ